MPLGEDSERYELDILKDGAVQRTLASATPQVLYPADHELADFGAARPTLSLRVAQISATVGRGFVTETTVDILPS